MSTKAVVVSVEADGLSVLPVAKLECASCSSSCSKKQELMSVTNPKHFPLQSGAVVIIELSGRRRAFEGVFSLLFPFCSAVAGYFAAAPFAARLSGRAADGMRALFVLLFLLLSSILVILITRLFPSDGRAEIVAVSSTGAGLQTDANSGGVR